MRKRDNVPIRLVREWPDRSLVDVIGHGNQRVATSLRCRDRHLRAPSHCKPRKAVAWVIQTLDELRVVQHLDKTFIGRISRGFDFLGYRISPAGLWMATQTVLDFVARICQLYEQGADSLRIGQYVKRWKSWATAARLSTCSVEPLSYACQLISTVLLGANAADASGVPPSVPAHPRLVRGCW